MKYHVLLLEDVTNHGRKGDLTHVASGFARNFLLPEGKAIMATHATVKTQARLQAERAEQAKKDKAESEKAAAALKGKILTTVVKVDNDGHMYGSVSVADILTLLLNDGVKLEKKHVALHMPIKSLGNHQVTLKLPEDVMAQITVEVKPDRIIEKKKKVIEEPKAEAAEGEEAKAEDQSDAPASE
jgi:large subunit ribosomal protein L9